MTESCQTVSVLNVPLDEVVILGDMTVWNLGGFTSTLTTLNWRAGDEVRYSSAPDDLYPPFLLLNLRTDELAGAYSLGIGTLAIVVNVVDGDICVESSLDDGTKWTACTDANEIRRWRAGDEVVIYETQSRVDFAINLRTGRVALVVN